MDQPNTPTDSDADSGGKPLTIRNQVVDPSNPDLQAVRSVELVRGPKHFKRAKHLIIVNRHTGEVHGDQLTIETYRLKKGAPPLLDDPHTVTLSSEDEDDQIQRLLDFIAASRHASFPAESGRFLVMGAPEDPSNEAVLLAVLDQVKKTGRYQAMADVLKQAAQNPATLHVLLERAASDPKLFAEAAAALNLVTYKNAVERLTALVNTPGVPEREFQKLLEDHPWLFGSEYSERLPRRNWTRDEQHDFVVRRTTDGYIELIEIKTPLDGASLFRHDPSHESFYPSVELAKVLGQVQKYLEELDAERNTILRKDGEDACKIRAKIIIGRDTDELQRQALRRLNGHLYRIEVLTFDQLLNIARNVLKYLETALHPPGDA